MALKDRILVISSMIILIISFPRGTFGQAQSNGTPAARALALQGLLDSVEGVAEEPPRIFKTKEGYLRFVGSPPSTHFPVDPNRRATPHKAADAFLAKNRNLFVNESSAVGFDTVRVKSRNGRTYVRYQQRYAGLEVFGAEMIVQVNVAGGIAAVMSDIMRDTEALDLGEVSLNPGIDALTGERKAIELLATQYEQLQLEATTTTLMIYHPSVVGNSGATQLV